jgi:proline racemase
VVFTGPSARPDADLRSITVCADGTVDRSPSGSGTAAVLAVLDAMGLASPDRPLRHEGPSGLTFEARVVDRVTTPAGAAIIAEVSGRAWVTGEHVFLLDPADPLKTGFVV